MLYTLLIGLLLGGMYSLLALGLTLQYGVSRIMNLSYGEFLIAAAFATFWLYTGLSVSPLVGLIIVAPAAFVLNWLIYMLLLSPLVERAQNRGMLEVDSMLATFGLLFIIKGAVVLIFGGAYYSYSYLSLPVDILGVTLAGNRLLAFVFAVVAGLGLNFFLMRTRIGTGIRAVAISPVSAGLVGINVRFTSALGFALGGALVACAGVLLSMFLTFNASMGVVFTIKALIIVIMGGVGNLLGCLIAGLVLGMTETIVATYIDPGLTLAATYALFLLILLFRPEGLFGKSVR